MVFNTLLAFSTFFKEIEVDSVKQGRCFACSPIATDCCQASAPDSVYEVYSRHIHGRRERCCCDKFSYNQSGFSASDVPETSDAYICLKGRTCESTGSSQRELSIGDCLHCATAFRLRLCLLPPLPRVGGRNKLAVPKEYASTFQVAFESFWQFMSACASILMLLLLAPVLQFVAVLLPAAWSDAKGATKTLWELLRSIPLSSTICQVALDTLWLLLLSACVSGL